MIVYDATGIDKADCDKYIRLWKCLGFRVRLYFIDPIIKSIYWNYLDVLINPGVCPVDGREYPLMINYKIPIILFDLCKMVKLCDIDKNDCVELENYTTRNYKY